ncbi:hypothetical protein I5438_03500 [Citrobacter freundii]|uniref:hypothetical protein n=1 Tax=Citrobacter freundii TaxID=546 RepID=UPI0018FF1F8E|nr:hypothetical protein [Citrobacter freundii]MBJ8974956.1 hypothetical protein [Citrobacter freundii]MBJ9012384.1 hypothetical protein [Citrobacter freundii]
MSSREKFEQAIKARFGDLIDYRVCKNSDGEYMAWDMQVAWWAWQASEASTAVQLANAESKCRELAAENAVKHEFIKTCFRAAADGVSMDGDDIQKLGERLGLFGREIYQPVLHGYICGHEAGEDTVYVMKKTPKTDAFLAEMRAQGVEMLLASLPPHYTAKADIAEFAAQLRKGAAL